MTIQKLLFAAAVSLVGGLIASGASANVKVYAPLLCVEENDTTPEIVYNQLMWASNSAGGSNTWICPVDRDDETGAVEDWDVTVNRNGNTADSWDLTLRSCDFDGNSCNTDTISVPATDGIQSLDGGSVSSFASSGLLFIDSSVPPSVRFHRYTIDE